METFGKSVFLVDGTIMAKEIASIHANAIGNIKISDEVYRPSSCGCDAAFDVPKLLTTSPKSDDDCIRSYYGLINSNPNARIYGVKNVFNILLGFAHYTLNRSTAFLNTVEVNKECQRKYVGSFLFRESLKSLVASQKISVVHTNIVADEDRLAFFRYCGFTNEDESPILVEEQANYELTRLKFLVNNKI